MCLLVSLSIDLNKSFNVKLFCEDSLTPQGVKLRLSKWFKSVSAVLFVYSLSVILTMFCELSKEHMHSVKCPTVLQALIQILFFCFYNTDGVVKVLWDLVLKIVDLFRVNDTLLLCCHVFKCKFALIDLHSTLMKKSPA